MNLDINSRGLRIMVGAFLLAAGVNIVNAQVFTRVGDLLDKGGERVNAATLRALLTGATVHGRAIFAFPINVESNYASDGKLSGTGFPSGGDPPYPFEGTWQVTDGGFLCTEVSSRYSTTKGCTPYYRHGDTYYAAQSDDRDARLRVREIKRQ